MVGITTYVLMQRNRNESLHHHSGSAICLDLDQVVLLATSSTCVLGPAMAQKSVCVPTAAQRGAAQPAGSGVASSAPIDYVIRCGLETVSLAGLHDNGIRFAAADNKSINESEAIGHALAPLQSKPLAKVFRSQQ